MPSVEAQDVLDRMVARWPSTPGILGAERAVFLREARGRMLSAIVRELFGLSAPTGRLSVPLAPLLVEWKPRFRGSFPPQYRTMPRRNADKVWNHIGVDLHFVVDSRDVRKQEHVRELLDTMRRAKEAGFELEKLRFAGFNQLGYVLVRDGSALTPAGAAALRSGLFDRPPTEHTAQDEAWAQRREDARMLARWMATLRPSTLENASAFSTKLHESPLGNRIALTREAYGAKQPYLAGFADGRQTWRFYVRMNEPGFAHIQPTYPDLLRAVVYYAAGNPELHWTEQDRRAEAQARAAKAAGKSVADVLSEAGFMRG